MRRHAESGPEIDDGDDPASKIDHPRDPARCLRQRGDGYHAEDLDHVVDGQRVLAAIQGEDQDLDAAALAFRPSINRWIQFPNLSSCRSSRLEYRRGRVLSARASGERWLDQPPDCSVTRGREKAKVLPWPREDFTHSVPPSISTRFFEM